MIWRLLTSRDFLPLFVTQFLGALNDNIFKSALVIFVLFTIAPPDAPLYTTAAAGVFILPFVLFSSLAGHLSDVFDKTLVMRMVKAAEIVIMLLAAAGFYLRSPPLLLFVLFLMGTHSAFFGPAKYSILPQHLPEKMLVAGNGLLSLGTFAAILLGTIAGTLGIAAPHGVETTVAGCLLIAAAGLFSCLYIPPAPPAAAHPARAPRLLKDAQEMLKLALADKAVRRPAIAISWFWFLGATYVTQFPNLAVQVIHADEKVVTLFLTMFTFGVAAGSLLCAKLLRDKISTRLAPSAALAMTVFGADFCAAAAGWPATETLNIPAFLALGFPAFRLLSDLFLLSVAGGVFYVPLYAEVQKRTPLARRARTMAGIGFLNALFMVLSSLLGIALLSFGFSGLGVIFTSVSMTLGIAAYCRNGDKAP